MKQRPASNNDNPYQSPQAESEPLEKQGISTLRGVVAGVLILVVSPITFCCVCYPIGVIGFTGPIESRDAIMTFGWVAGAVGGIGVGWLIYRGLIGSRRKKP